MPMTPEDIWIWGFSYPRDCDARFARSLYGESMQSDQRDAKLMVRLQEARIACDRAGVAHCLIAYEGLFVPQFDDPERSLQEQGLALLIPKLPARYRNG